MTPRPPKHTAASIAHGHFEKDLALHEEESSRQAETIVVLHDACYGHRYSRPRTSKASLSTIVERPERIHASVLGLSVAYVRLGERHAEGSNPLHPDVDPSTIPSTPFRIRKTTRRLSLSSQAVTNVHGTKWMEELKIMCEGAEAKLAMNGKELTRPDMTRSPTQDAPPKLHEGDLYLCAESLNAMEGALGAVCEGVDAVFQGAANGKGPRRTFVAIRPPGHHCSASYPSGFCWLNNVHVGISHAALTHGLTHAAIIDFDLHHGDGSQAIAWEHNKRAFSMAKNALPWKKTSIGYFSLHDINSYPCEMGDEEKVKNASLCIENAHGQSIWNVHLQPWKSENDFWELYETKYSVLLEKTRNFLRAQTERLQASTNGPRPKAAIFLSAGFDASEWESSGMQRHKVNVPTEFYARLTRDVVKLAAEEGTSIDGRIISVLEGGYSDRALYSGVFSHLSGLAGRAPMVIRQETSQNGLGYEMGQKMGGLNGFDNAVQEPLMDQVPMYDPLWWSAQRLEQLDAIVKPSAPPPEPRKPRDGTPPTYSSPTQSFIAKVASPRAQRNVSNMSNGSPRPVSRAPTPPPPEVDWTVAAHELSKLLIPLDRQTMSCRPEARAPFEIVFSIFKNQS
jgi:histone deacetylase HOS3